MTSLGARGVLAPLDAARPSCSLHRYHRPRALTVELHHLVPRAWQAFYRPPGTGVASRLAIADSELWHPETVALCPTTHRNVHVWIVRFMRASADPDPDAARVAVGRPRGKEPGIAYRALTEWVDAGGSLTALRDARLFGEA